MKLWLLRPVRTLTKKDNPWEPWYDTAGGFVVRAESEEDARNIAQENAGDEASHGPFKYGTDSVGPWVDAKYSTCEVLHQDGVSGLIIQDFRAA